MIRPISNKIVVKITEDYTTSDGGLHLAKSDMVPPQRGLVMATGKGRVTSKGELLPISVKVGQNIIFEQKAGEKIDIDGSDYILMSEDNVVMVLD